MYEMPIERGKIREFALATHSDKPAFTRTDIVRDAGAAGDFNPIHHAEELARDAGAPTVISIGKFQAGLLASIVRSESSP